MIEIELDGAEQLGAFVRAVYSDQLPFATSKAINLTAKDFQAAQRAHQRTIWQIKNPRFVDSAVKIKPFATKQVQAATVRVDPVGGMRRASVLTKFEDESVKKPFGSHQRIAVPTPNVKRTATGGIPKGWRPKNLGLQGFKGEGHAKRKKQNTRVRVFSRKGRSVLVGRDGIVAIQNPGGRGVIFQRDPRGRKTTALYWFKPAVPIKPELRFFENAQRAVQAKWDSNFSKSFTEVMRTARGTRL